jgi:hypothetical protein
MENVVHDSAVDRIRAVEARCGYTGLGMISDKTKIPPQTIWDIFKGSYRRELRESTNEHICSAVEHLERSGILEQVSRLVNPLRTRHPAIS